MKGNKDKLEDPDWDIEVLGVNSSIENKDQGILFCFELENS